eukprot:scaffold121013_cov26-Tisochrysis_lutea.AAC.3
MVEIPPPRRAPTLSRHASGAAAPIPRRVAESGAFSIAPPHHGGGCVEGGVAGAVPRAVMTERL